MKNTALEELIDLLCHKTQNTDRQFFKTVLCYFFGKMASSMRASIETKDRGSLPVNIYSIGLAASGFGKGHSVAIIENELLKKFQERFEDITVPTVATKNLNDLIVTRAVTYGEDNEDYDVMEEYKSGGVIPFTFDSGTTPAIKQLRNKLLMGQIGSINVQVDEIGSNLVSNTEVLNVFLELYDLGCVKQKLTKNTSDNVRAKEIRGRTPANMLLFGTPSKLFDGSNVEDAFYSFLETGYARRCFFGFGSLPERSNTLTPAEIFFNLVNPKNNEILTKWQNHFESLASEEMYNWTMYLKDETAIHLIAYKMECENEANSYPEHEIIRKAETSHRYFKALKLAGALAFVSKCKEITLDHLKQSIEITQESGEIFKTLLKREKSYMRIARFIADSDTELTHSDLVEALPFYKSTAAGRNEQISLAIAWGYKQHIVIRRFIRDGVELFTGERLKETDLNKVLLSYSADWAHNYVSYQIPFEKLPRLLQAKDLHWTNHEFLEGHREEKSVKEGFNLLVLDIDHGNLEQVHSLLSDYEFMTCTTKRHTDMDNRFRLVMPINYTLKLNREDYAEFMSAVVQLMPFKVDETANQRSRKWATYENGQLHHNKGILLDVLPLIPKTSRYKEREASNSKIGSIDNIERWFMRDIEIKGRNNQLLRYALMLVDAGDTQQEIINKVFSFNDKIPNPLSKAELTNTILKTVENKFKEMEAEEIDPDDIPY